MVSRPSLSTEGGAEDELGAEKWPMRDPDPHRFDRDPMDNPPSHLKSHHHKGYRRLLEAQVL